MKPSEQCKDFIKGFESFAPVAYKCPAGVWTIGYGSTKGVKEGDTISKGDAEYLFEMEVAHFASEITRLTKVPLLQHQFDALVSFTFNVGVRNYEKSTLRKLILAAEFDAASNEFGKWIFAGKKKLNGLIKRRAQEADMFRGNYNG